MPEAPMIRRRYELYGFDELAPAARDKVLDSQRHLNVEDDAWYEHLLDEWKGTLEGLGYEVPRILFSGFGSQGDGACFEARVNIPAWLSRQGLAGRFRRLARASQDGDAEITIRHSGRYYHAASTEVEEQYEGSDAETAGELEEVMALIKAEKVDLSQQIYRALEAEYTALTSDSAVADTIQGNAMLFHADGCQAHA
jgi:hypothetical protein